MHNIKFSFETEPTCLLTQFLHRSDAAAMTATRNRHKNVKRTTKITDTKIQTKMSKAFIKLCDKINLPKVHLVSADPAIRAVSGLGLRPLCCWDFGFEFRLGHGCLSPVNLACFHVEISATDRSLVQRSPTECGVSECRLETSVVRRPWHIRGCCTKE